MTRQISRRPFVLPVLLGLLRLALPLPAGATGLWTSVPAPIFVPLRGVKFIDRIDAWGVGDLGSVCRYGNGTWSNYPSGTDQALNAVTSLADGTAWAAGASGTLIHFRNTVWSPDPASQVLTLLPLHDVKFLNADNGWAVGGDAALGGIILHYVGGGWVTATVTMQSIEGVALIASDNVRFCGRNGWFSRFDGTSFLMETVSPPNATNWHAISFPFRGIGWAVGDAGQVERYSSATGSWTGFAQGSGLTTATLFACSFVPDNGAGYAVGQGGVRLAFDGAAFSLDALGGPDLFGVDLPDPLEGAAVGGATLPQVWMLRLATTETDLTDYRVFPNPYDANQAYPLTFDKLPGDVNLLAIYTLKGELVADLTRGITYDPAAGLATWNGRIFDAYCAASGSYLYRIGTKSGKTARGVFLIQKK